MVHLDGYLANEKSGGGKDRVGRGCVAETLLLETNGKDFSLKMTCLERMTCPIAISRHLYPLQFKEYPRKTHSLLLA